MWPANWESEEERVQVLLEEWRGSMAEAWAYTVSHGQFLLRLHRQSEESLFVWFKNCRNVQFAPSWQASSVKLERNADGALLATDGGNLNVSCASIQVAENDGFDVEPLFGSIRG